MSLLHNLPDCFTEKKNSETMFDRRGKTQIDGFCEIVIENFLLPGFKILANSLENTCKGFYFSGSTAGWKHETLQNWTSSQVFVKDFAEIFSNYKRFENPFQQMSLNTFSLILKI